MSYLAYCDYTRTRDDRVFGKTDTFAIKWRGTTGTIQVVRGANGEVFIYFNRYTKLGGLLRFNRECERNYIAKSLAEHYATRDDTRITFTGF